VSVPFCVSVRSSAMMRPVYIVSALLLCHSVCAERDTDCSAKLTPEAEMRCRLAKKKKAASSMQHVQAASFGQQMRLSTQVNTAILLHIANIEDEKNFAKFQTTAVNTILAAIQLFTVKNQTAHNITQGISIVGLGLWDCIMMFVPESVKGLEVLQWFDKAWTATFSTLYSTDVEQIEEDVQEFNENGKGHKIAHVVARCVDSAVKLIGDFVNGTVAAKIMPWFEGVRDITHGVAKSWEAIANGEPDKAAQAVYAAIRSASDAVLPASVKTHTAYEYITKILDEQIGNLNQYVMKFKKDLAMSKICVRGTLDRNTSRGACPPGYTVWAGSCHKDVCPSDGSFIQQYESGSRQELLATVHTESNCPEREVDCANIACLYDRSKRVCRADCPKGFREVKSVDYCYQDCPDDFPNHVDGKKKCARSEAAWEELNMERLTAIVTAGTQLAGILFKGINAIVHGDQIDDAAMIKSMNHVIKSGVDFAASFFFADCAMPEVVPSIDCASFG